MVEDTVLVGLWIPCREKEYTSALVLRFGWSPYDSGVNGEWSKFRYWDVPPDNSHLLKSHRQSTHKELCEW